MAQKRLHLVSGRSHPQLAAAIAGELGIGLGTVELGSPADGEGYCRFGDSVRGADVYVVQTAARPLGEYLVELLVLINAARLASARRVTVVAPCFFYARQDRKTAPREPVTARLVASLLESAGADRVLTMDLHAGQIQGFFHLPVDHMTALPMFAERVRSLADGRDVVVVVPATTRAKQGAWLARTLHADLALVAADDRGGWRTTVIGEADGKIAVLLENAFDTGEWFCAAAGALAEVGVGGIYACATHGVFAPGAASRLASSPIERLLITDTLPLPHDGGAEEKLEVLSTASLLANTIASVFADQSVSALFVGDNQLF